MARNLSRNTELYISTIPPATFNDTNCVGIGGPAVGSNNTWKLNILDGFSFSQDVTTQDIGVSESSSECSGLGQLARGTLGFNTALNPVDVSFSTYVRPYNSDTFGEPNCVELPLWAGCFGDQAALTASPDVEGTAVFETDLTDPELVTFSTQMSDINELLPLYLYFKLETTCYVIEEFQVNSAEVDFSIDGIATINWSGNGTVVKENESVFDILEDTGTFQADTDYVNVPTTTSSSFLRNKLSTLELVDNQDSTPGFTTTIVTSVGGIITVAAGTLGTTGYEGGRVRNTDLTPDQWVTILSHTDTAITVSAADAAISDHIDWADLDAIEIFKPAEHSEIIYCIPITGGSITVDNGVTYLTPEELAIVNQPLAGFTGSRAISGSFTAYLNTGAQGSGGLLQDLLEKITEVSNDYSLVLRMGGSSTSDTHVAFTIPHAQVSIPSTNVEDVISTEISFTAKSWVNGVQSFEGANEMTIAYITPGS